MENSEDKVYDVSLVVEELKYNPHTYETILGGKGTGTQEFILRRKLNNLCKQGIVCKSTIPGTRFGKCIFFVLPKNYRIIVEASRMGSRVYFFSKYNRIDKITIKADVYFELDGSKWVRKTKKIFKEGNILSFF